MPPTIGRLKVVTWNIEALAGTAVDKGKRKGGDFSSRADMVAAMLWEMDFDIAVIVELNRISFATPMNHIVERLNDNTMGYVYSWYVSAPTGLETYGFIIRNMSQNIADWHIKPVFSTKRILTVSHGLDRINYEVKKADNSPQRQVFELVDTFGCVGENCSITALKDKDGKDYLRHPAMGLFLVRNNGNNGWRLIPIIAVHTKSGQTGATKFQIHRLKALAISQMYLKEELLRVDDQDYPVQNLIVTGDFNANALDGTKGNWYDYLTFGGADTTRPNGVMEVDRDIYSFPNLNLHPAIHTTKTILYQPEISAALHEKTPYHLNDITSGLLDNLFFGGRNLSQVPGNDEPGTVEDVSTYVYVRGFQDNGRNFWSLVEWAVSNNKFNINYGTPTDRKKFNKKFEGTLNPLDNRFYNSERIIIMRTLSDHLPVSMEFTIT